ncbi:MAG TPA: alpha/beta hydrolase-fold protein [Chloroflexota bacterium]|nr:alpha/beta hydrolase-fold protein [Chloroflexota bacterium]
MSMPPWRTAMQGRFEELTISSAVLEGNPLGDPSRRPLLVYLPPGYEESRHYPAIYLLQGLTRQLDMWWNRSAFRPTVPELIDRVFGEPDVPPCVVVLVDAWTSLGGSQFLNSSGTGRYLDYLSDEVVAVVDERFATIPDRDHRALAGHSSGGYGAIVVSLVRPDMFGAFAAHSADALFEVCYQPEFREAARALQGEYAGDWTAFWEDFHSRPAFSKRYDHLLLNIYCMAACYSAQPDGSPAFPFDLATGRTRQEVWDRWLALDPVRLASHHGDALRSMRGVYLDAGRRDEAFLDLGATAFARELDRLGVAHHFELFDGGHGSVEYRYPLGWRYLAERLTS